MGRLSGDKACPVCCDSPSRHQCPRHAGKIMVRKAERRHFSRVLLYKLMRLPLSRASLAKATLLFAVWTAYGLFSTWQSHYWYSFGKNPISWADSLRYEMTYAWLWGACTPAVLWLSKRFRIERAHWVRHLLVHIAVMTVLAALTKTLFELNAGPHDVGGHDAVFVNFTLEKLFRSIVFSLDTGALLYCMIILVEHSFVYYKRYQNGLLNAGRLQTELARAQLQALKMQLHPHFLFNTLHTITALVHEDPERAERTIARLSELLRLFLATSTIHEVPLGEELRILDLYLEIERTRFEDRLSVHCDVPDELRDAMVPNLVLQPIVENALRHGVGRKSGPGWISIAAEKYGETLVLRVTDNGEGLPTEALGHDTGRHPESGKGLAITRGRLESLYGSDQSLLLRNLQTGGAEVRITMPFRKQVEDPRVQNPGEGENAEFQSANR
jgi:two-component system LytT family sensor kinase